MKNYTYPKKCEVGKLTEELKNAGYDIFGVSGYGGNVEKNIKPETIVHLANTETKDPTSIVNAHVYTAPVITPPRDYGKEIDDLIATLKAKGILP